MAKIGIYIPDERMKDIEANRSKINYSQLFMQAFDEMTTSPKKRERQLRNRVNEATKILEDLARQIDDAKKSFKGLV